MDTASPTLRVELRTYDDPVVTGLVEQLQQEFVVRYGGRDETPVAPSTFAAPNGAFFVGFLGDEPVATGAWRWRSDVAALDGERIAEIKRMYVVPGHQRRGLARAMLAHLEASALEAGADVMVLETGLGQPEAIALYESSGYARIPSFGHYKDSPLNRCFARRLG